MVRTQKWEVCVDLGCGKGTDVIRLREAVGDGHVYGVDISEGMLAKAKKRGKVRGTRMSPLFVRSWKRLNLGGGVADLVISNCTINHAHDKRAVWSRSSES